MSEESLRIKLLAQVGAAAVDGQLTTTEALAILSTVLEMVLPNLDKGDAFLIRQASEVAAELAARREDGLSLDDIKAAIVHSYNPKKAERFYPE